MTLVRSMHDPGLDFTLACSPPPNLTPYIFKEDDRYIAGGGFGDVYKCRYYQGAPKEVAVKAFRFSFALDGNTNNKSHKMLRRELGIWRRLDHANIVPFLGIAYGFGMLGAMSLVSLWMPNGSLHHFLEKYDDKLDLGHRLQFLLDIANGLHYLHSFSSTIVHGDLNGNNVLIDADYTARLTDFGYASLVGNIPEALKYLERSTARPGALRWMAPEQIRFEESFQRTTKSDVYSFGCVALQVLSGKPPWAEVREDMSVVLRLAKGDKPRRPVSGMLQDSHWDLIQQCWSSVEARPPVKNVIPSIEHFLRHCPPSLPLSKVLASSHENFLDELLPSFSTYIDPSKGFESNIHVTDKQDRKRPYQVSSATESEYIHDTSKVKRKYRVADYSGLRPIGAWFDVTNALPHHPLGHKSSRNITWPNVQPKWT